MLGKGILLFFLAGKIPAVRREAGHLVAKASKTGGKLCLSPFSLLQEIHLLFSSQLF